MKKLSELVNSALEDATMKVASARDAEKTAGLATTVGEKVLNKAVSSGVAGTSLGGKAIDAASHIGQKYLGAAGHDAGVGRTLLAAGGLTAAGGGAAALASRKKESSEVISTATEAMKFAESLEHLAMLFPKLAAESHSVNDLAGPATLVSPSKGGTKDTSTKAKTLTQAEASHQGGSGDDMHVQTFKSDTSKKVAEAMLEAKIAQSQALISVGQAQAATQLMKQAQAEFERAKLAFAPTADRDRSTADVARAVERRQKRPAALNAISDFMDNANHKMSYDEEASTPKGTTQSLAVNRGAGDFPVAGKVPDNAGMISMTKRQAKTEDVRREAGKHVSETALSSASDKGLTDNVEHTEGAKIAFVNAVFQKAAMRKQAAEGERELKWHEKARIPAGTMLGGGAGAALGGAAGYGLGHALGLGNGPGSGQALLAMGTAGLGAGIGSLGGSLAAQRTLHPDAQKAMVAQTLADPNLHPEDRAAYEEAHQALSGGAKQTNVLL